MPGFDIQVPTPGTSNSTMYADNVDFTGNAVVAATVTTNGQLLIGSTAAPNIRVGSLSSTGGSVVITTGAGTINLEAGATTPTSFTTDSGVATPSLNNLFVFGTGGINTTGSGSTVTITANGAVIGKTITGNTGGALSPTAGNWNILGASTAAGTSPVTTAGAGSTLTINVQKAQAIAATDATKVGLANFDSTDFTVDANGFVALAGAGAGQTITGDSGGALVPSSGNWNILGRSGSKTAGSGSTITVNSPPYADQAGSTSVTLNSGSFATNAITLTTPVTAGLLDGDLLEFVATNGVLVIQLAATQVAHLGSAATSAAGTINGTATGDSISLRYQASTNDWWATSSIGIWNLA